MSYVDELCSRCGSPKKVIKKRKEILETYSGKSVIEVSQIVCTNKTCQAEFEKNRAKELARYNELKKKKEEQDQNRKDTIVNRLIERKKNAKKTA